MAVSLLAVGALALLGIGGAVLVSRLLEDEFTALRKALKLPADLQPPTAPPPLPPSNTPAPAPAGSTTLPAPAPAKPLLPVLFSQAQIISALWQVAKSGNTTEVERIRENLDSLPTALAAYFVAAAAYVNQAFLIDLKFRAEFTGKAREAQAAYEKQMNELDAGLGAAAGAVNVIPVAGPILSAFITLGIALRKAIQEALGPVTTRATDDNEKIYKDWEGSNCRRGLHLDSSANPSQSFLIRAVDSDLIAGTLPTVPNAYQFEYTPTLGQFQKAALQLGLYSNENLKKVYGFAGPAWNVNPAEGVPTSAYDINRYITGYVVGQSGEAYTEENYWGKMGYLDARGGKPSRVAGDLSLWAEDTIAALSKPA